MGPLDDERWFGQVGTRRGFKFVERADEPFVYDLYLRFVEKGLGRSLMAGGLV